MPSHSLNKTWRGIRSGWRSRLAPGRNAVAAVPLLWLAVFFGLPFLIILRISLSEAVIGLTVMSLGTSLPELATATAAIRRRARPAARPACGSW